MRYAVRKGVTLLMTMLIVSFLAFLAFELVSGDAAVALLAGRIFHRRSGYVIQL